MTDELEPPVRLTPADEGPCSKCQVVYDRWCPCHTSPARAAAIAATERMRQSPKHSSAFLRERPEPPISIT